MGNSATQEEINEHGEKVANAEKVMLSIARTFIEGFIIK
jgi:hypothetical protein